MASTGYKAPSSAKQFTDHISGTVYPYEDIGNVKACDGARATVDSSGGTTSSKSAPDIVVYGFGNNIKQNARIDGITVKINRQKAVYAGEVRDTIVRLREGDTSVRGVMGNNYAKTSTNWPEKSTGSAVYGSASDKWGVTLTPVRVNSSAFGLLMRCQGTNSEWTIPSVDCMHLAVEFTDPTYSLSAPTSGDVFLGGFFNWVLTLRNTNSVHQGYAIPVSLALPSGCTLVEQSGSNGSYNASTGMWNAVLANGSATITLKLQANTVGNKTAQASVDGFSTSLITPFTVINPQPEYTITMVSNDSVELLADQEVTISVNAEVYDLDTVSMSLPLPSGLALKSTSIVSSTNIANLGYTNEVLSFNLASLSSYFGSFDFKLVLTPWGMGSKTLTILESDTGATTSDTFTVVRTTSIDAYGQRTQIKTQTMRNAVAYPDVVKAFAGGVKHNIISTCKATSEIIKGFIGPVQLSRPHSAKNLKNTTQNDVIEEIYKNRGNMGKKGNYSEEIPLVIRLPPEDAVTMQGLVELDEPIPLNTCVKCKDADPLNHRGYAEIHKCVITKVNSGLMECDIGVKYLTRNLNPPIYIKRLSQINKYNLKPLYPMELMNTSMALSEYFDIGLENATLNTKTATITGLGSFKLKSKDIVSTPATIEYTWSSSTILGVERIIRILDETDNILMEYIVDGDVNGEYATLTVFKDSGAHVTNEDIDLGSSTFSTITHLTINDNVVSILEEGASGVELFLDGIILDDGNYQLETEIRHKTSTTSDTTVDFNIDETHLLTNEKAYYVNQVVSSFPLRDKLLQYTREAEDGVLYYYQHDETISKYYTQPFNLYKGGTNVTTLSGASLLSNRYQVDPICLTNGQVKIVFSFRLRTIIIYFYDSTTEEGWQFVAKFRLVNMENTHVKYLSQDKAIMACGSTLWTIWRGRYWVDVQHPEEDLFLLEGKDTVWKDNGSGVGTESAIVEGAEISLNNLYYLLLHNSTENYGLQIIRPDYSSIFDKKIPRNSKTVLMPYKKDDKEYNQPGRLAVEWFNMYEQRIDITGR